MADSVNFSTTLDEVESLINQGIAEAQSNFTGEGENSEVSSILSQIQSSIQQGINEARSNSTAEEGDTSASTNSFAEFFANNLVGEESNTSESSNSSAVSTEATTTQEGLSEAGQQQVVANVGSDSLTNPSEGNSNGAYSFNFQDSDIKPIFDESTGKVSLEINGQTVDLFSFNSGGSAPSFGGGGSFGGGSFGGGSGGGSGNPFASGSSDGGNPFASGGGGSFGGGSFGGGSFGGGGFGA